MTVNYDKANATILLYDNPFNMFNNSPLNHIILHEECSELIKVSSKVMRFGPTNFNPATPTVTNRDMLVQEMGDVLALIDIIRDDPDLKITNNELKDAKFKKLRKMLDFYDRVDDDQPEPIVPEEHFRSCQESAAIADEYDND